MMTEEHEGSRGVPGEACYDVCEKIEAGGADFPYVPLREAGEGNQRYSLSNATSCTGCAYSPGIQRECRSRHKSA